MAYQRKYGGKAGYGHIADPKGQRVAGFHLVPYFNVNIIPDNASLEQFCPPIMDQDGTSSCTGNATSCTIYTSMASSGRKLSFVPSQQGLYALGRMIGRSPVLVDGHYIYPAIQDGGAQPCQIMSALYEWGMWPMIMQATPDGRFSDVTTENVNHEPTVDLLKTGQKNAVVGEYLISSAGATRIQDFRKSIGGTGNDPVAMSIPVYQDFEEFRGTGVYAMKHGDSDPDCLGWHYVSMVGYRKNAAGKFEFRLRNSWGPDWGDHGSAWVDEALIQVSSDAYCMSVNPRAS